MQSSFKPLDGLTSKIRNQLKEDLQEKMHPKIKILVNSAVVDILVIGDTKVIL